MRIPEEIIRQSERRAPTRPATPQVAERLNEILAEVPIEGAERALGDAAGIVDAPAAVMAARARTAAARATARIPRAPLVARVAAAGLRPTDTELERMIGTNDLVDEFYLERALVAARPVCRLVVRDAATGRNGYATGFMVSPRLLLTNWHVFPAKDDARGAVAQFNYKLDIRGNEAPVIEFAIDPEAQFLSDGQLDFALVAVSPTSQNGGRNIAEFGYHRLIADENKIEKGEWITIIQHPGGKRREFSIRENQLLEIQDPFLWYASDTAQGSSGSPAFNDQLQVVALHHSGKARRDEQGNYVLKDGSRVASLKDVDDADVDWEKNEGLRVSRLCQRIADAIARGEITGDYAVELNQAMKGGDVMTRVINGESSTSTEVKNNGDADTQRAAAGDALRLLGDIGGGAASVQLNIATVNVAGITIGAPAPAVPIKPEPVKTPHEPADLTEIEKLVEPITDSNYSNRKGYDEGYLGIPVPLPEATSKAILSKMDDGKYLIPYEHFSVVINKERRLALFTASNVDGRVKNRQPGGVKPTRKDLTGLGPNDLEKWITDPRIPEQHQLPDTFYTNDRQAFDKGHIVRRDDVCWGKSMAQIRRANGDTFHTTNCSPQVKNFNQSGADGLWGKLENTILSQAKAETYCLFAGPVMDADDPVFHGRDLRGKVEIQIPQRYWKIVVARKGNALQSFGFVLEQDLGNVKFVDETEFVVPEEWQSKLIRIQELEDLLGNVKFPKAVKDADQYDESGGQELLKADGLEKYVADA